MKPEILARIWTVVAAGGAYFSINVFLATQGGHFRLPGLKLEGVGPHAAAVYGTWFVSPLVLLSMGLAMIYAKRAKTRERWGRFPVAFGLDLDFRDWLSRSYQVFFFGVFVVLPTYTACHFLRKSLNGTVVDKKTGVVVADSPWDHLFTYSPFSEIFTDGNRYRVENEVTFFPFWQPWVGVLLTGAIVALGCYLAYVLLSRKVDPGPDRS